jgi:hypothetical protein
MTWLGLAFTGEPIPNSRLRYANAASDLPGRFVAQGEVFLELPQRCFQIRLSHLAKNFIQIRSSLKNQHKSLDPFEILTVTTHINRVIAILALAFCS